MWPAARESRHRSCRGLAPDNAFAHQSRRLQQAIARPKSSCAGQGAAAQASIQLRSATVAGDADYLRSRHRVRHIHRSNARAAAAPPEAYARVVMLMTPASRRSNSSSSAAPVKSKRPGGAAFGDALSRSRPLQAMSQAAQYAGYSCPQSAGGNKQALVRATGRGSLRQPTGGRALNVSQGAFWRGGRR